MMFGKVSPTDRARDELDELDREEFTLRKNMMHDRHRMAYIRARRRQLKADHPPVVQPPVAKGSVISWLRVGSAVPDPLLPWIKEAKS